MRVTRRGTLLAGLSIAAPTSARIDVIYGSSGKIATQIRHGAPFDVFLSADLRFHGVFARNSAHRARGDEGQAGQGRNRPGRGPDRRAHPGRAPGGDDLGTTPQARVRHRRPARPVAGRCASIACIEDAVVIEKILAYLEAKAAAAQAARPLSHRCGHCRRAQPVIAAAFAGHPGGRHLKFADAAGRRLGRSFRVKLWPTLVFLKDGKELARVVRPADAAAVPAALERIDGES